MLGNLLAGIFSGGRSNSIRLGFMIPQTHIALSVVQELGREGVLPYSTFFASSKPFNGPMAGLFTQYLFSVVLMLAPPPGEAYLVLVSCEFDFPLVAICNHSLLTTCIGSMYSVSAINTLVSFGLLLLYTPLYRDRKWDPPFRAPKFAIIAFFLCNVFLVVAPLMPPVPGSRTYEHLPYWVSMVAWSFIRTKPLPPPNAVPPILRHTSSVPT